MLELNIENQPQPQFNHKEKFVNNLFSNEVENVLTDLKTDLSTYSLYQNLVLKDNRQSPILGFTHYETCL